MKLKKLFAALFAASLCCLPGPAVPDDIDLYTGGEAITGAETNVLVFLDNSANWSNASGWPATQGEAELDALKTVIDSLNDTINLGLVMHTRTGSTSSAYVRFAMRPMNATNRAALKSLLDDIKSTAPNAPQDKVSQSADGDAAIEEVFRYYSSLAKGQSITDTKQDYPNNGGSSLPDTASVTYYYSSGGGVSTSLAEKAHPASTLGSHAYSSLTATDYSGPTSAKLGCAKNYLIWIGNTSLDGSTSTTRLTDAASAVGVTLPASDTEQIAALSTATGAAAPRSLMIDEWAKFMYKHGVKTNITKPGTSDKYWNSILTYTVDVFPKAGLTEPITCTAETAGGSQQVSQHFIMESTARAGGGKCFPATSTTQLAKALQTIFAEIQAVNSVFASATLPVSVNTQGTYENQIYIGVFRPDGFSRPRWYGNLKEYKFGRYCDTDGDDQVDNVGGSGDERIDGNSSPPTCTGDTLKLYLADRNNKPAIDSTLGTGFIALTATSYWTQDSTFWSFSPDLTAGSSDAPDGPSVERGGAAYRLRTLFPVKTAVSGEADIDHRKVYTCLGNCLTGTADQRLLSGYPFSTTNTEVMTRLATGWPMSVSLSRSGSTVTVTTPTAHGLSAGNSVTISGTNIADYDKTHTVVSGSGTTLTFNVTEKPLNDTSGTATVSTSVTTQVAISSIAVNTAGTEATVTTSAAHPFETGDQINIQNATQSFLNGVKTITKLSTTSFKYPISWTRPVAATTAGTTSIGSPVNQSQSNSALSIPDTALLPTIAMGRWGADVPATGNPKVTVGSTQITISGTTPSDYSGTFTLYETGGSCPGTSTFTAAQKRAVYCYNLIKTESGGSLQATKVTGTQIPVHITRSGTTATAVLQTGALPAGTTQATIIGSSQSEYNIANGAITLDPALDRFTFTVPVSPATSATGSATIPNQPTVSATNLVNWMRGVDTNEDENANNSKEDVRASIHGDVLHSRPLLINYGGSTGIVGFYGSNDGYLRAIKGGVADTDGGEKWAFIPDEFISRTKLARLYDNSEIIRFPNSSCPVSGAATPSARNYFWDGQLSAYQSSDLATTYLFAGMRRGGQSVYALNISNPDTPRFMWRITSGTTGFSQLGQTWSEPKVAWIKDASLDTTTGAGNGKRLVLIFGAGYDPTDDDQKPGAIRGDRTGYTGIGRGVYVVDALTGALIQFLQPPSGVTKYSFAADVSLFDSNGDGFVDRIYAVDTGAQIFRFDHDGTVNPTTSSAWNAYHLASFGDTTQNGGADARKFMFPPELVPFVYKHTDGTTSTPAVMVLVGSGDREKPLPNKKRNGTSNVLSCSTLYSDTYFGDIVNDRFYALIDSTSSLGAAPTVAMEADMAPVNTNSNALAGFNLCYGFQTNCVANTTNTIKKGWMIYLKNDPDGLGYGEEKMVNAPRVVSGIALFGTNTPQLPNLTPASGEPLVCQTLGQARTYALSPFTGLPAFDRDNDNIQEQDDYAAKVTGGGLPPSVTAGVVGITDNGATSYYRFVIGGGGTSVITDSAISGAKNPITLRGTRTRIYWYYPDDEK